MKLVDIKIMEQKMGYSAKIYDYFWEIGINWWCVIACLMLITLTFSYLAGLQKKYGMARTTIMCCAITYYFFIYVSTVLSRQRGNTYLYHLDIFWTYKQFAEIGVLGILYENIYNILMFIPIGYICSILTHKRCIFKGTLIGFGLSLLIEISQLVLKCGYFEFDDLFHNTVGATLGALLFVVLRRFLKYFRKK